MEASVAADPGLAAEVVKAMAVMRDHLGQIAKVAAQDGDPVASASATTGRGSFGSTTTTSCGEAVGSFAEYGKRAFGPSFLCGVAQMEETSALEGQRSGRIAGATRHLFGV